MNSNESLLCAVADAESHGDVIAGKGTGNRGFQLIRGQITDLMDEGWLRRDGDGRYALTEGGRRRARELMKGGRSSEVLETISAPRLRG